MASSAADGGGVLIVQFNVVIALNTLFSCCLPLPPLIRSLQAVLDYEEEDMEAELQLFYNVSTSRRLVCLFHWHHATSFGDISELLVVL